MPNTYVVYAIQLSAAFVCAIAAIKLIQGTRSGQKANTSNMANGPAMSTLLW